MAQMDCMRPEGLPVKDRHSGPPGRDAQRTPGRPAGATLNLIHRTNSPNPVTARVPGRLVVENITPGALVAWVDFLDGPVGRLLLMRRGADATKAA